MEAKINKNRQGAKDSHVAIHQKPIRHCGSTAFIQRRLLLNRKPDTKQNDPVPFGRKVGVSGMVRRNSSPMPLARRAELAFSTLLERQRAWFAMTSGVSVLNRDSFAHSCGLGNISFYPLLMAGELICPCPA